MAFTTFVDSINAAGGVIPTEWSDQIISQLPSKSAALTMFRTVPMGTKTEILPVLTGLATADFVGEASPISVTNPIWQGKNLVAAKIASIVPFAREVLEDSSFDLQANVFPQVAEAIGAKIDAAVLFGAGKPATWTSDDLFTGCGTATATVNYVADELVSNINSVMGLVEGQGFDVSGFIGANAMKANLRGLLDSTGRPIYAPLTSTEPASIWGEQIAFSRNGGFDTTKALMFAGDFSKAILGLRSDIRVEVLTESSLTSGADTISLGQSDMIGLRFVMRVAYAAADCGTRLGGSNAWPFAALIPAAG